MTADASMVLPTLDRVRLRIARELRDLTQTDLATAVGVTPAAVSQFESTGAAARPSATTLTRIAETLDVPVDFFIERPGVDPAEQITFFRSLRSTTKREQRREAAVAWFVHEFSVALSQFVTLPAPDLPRFPNARTDEAIEAAATDTRTAMGLDGRSPVDDVVRAIERRGIVTARVRAGTAKVDAYSVVFDDRPVIVLGNEKGVRDRSRFDAAHELGHIVLGHTAIDVGTREAENQAHLFAASFLMPRGGIAGELPDHADWNALIQLKIKWQVSIAALLKRAQTLGRMNDYAYVQSMKAISARRWRTQEPVDLGAPEDPILLSRAVSIAEANGISLERIAASRGLPVQDVTGMLRPSIRPKPVVSF